jgi:hypothetical protein
MVDEDLGTATIVYEQPDGDTAEMTVQNEYLAYFQDHWIVRADDTDAAEPDTVRRIPHQRVYYVERTVEEFEEEVTSLRNEVESFADDVQTKLFGDDENGGN